MARVLCGPLAAETQPAPGRARTRRSTSPAKPLRQRLCEGRVGFELCRQGTLLAGSGRSLMVAAPAKRLNAPMRRTVLCSDGH